VRDWLFVDDHARALIDIVERGRAGETYCIGGNAERTNLDVVQAICDIVDDRRPAAAPRRELIRFVTDRPGHDARYAIDSTKLQDELGWSPSLDFETGLAQTVDWYLDHEAWWRPIQDGVYRQERLGLPA
jgi:dTDP-glucose 4,6-dehydratase